MASATGEHERRSPDHRRCRASQGGCCHPHVRLDDEEPEGSREARKDPHRAKQQHAAKSGQRGLKRPPEPSRVGVAATVCPWLQQLGEFVCDGADGFVSMIGFPAGQGSSAYALINYRAADDRALSASVLPGSSYAPAVDHAG
jgi:hypothetical protein